MTGDGLSIKDEERKNTILIPKIEVLVDVSLDASQTAEGREQRFVSRRGVEKLAQIVRRIDGNGAVFEFREVDRAELVRNRQQPRLPFEQPVASANGVQKAEVEGQIGRALRTYYAWLLIQVSSMRTGKKGTVSSCFRQRSNNGKCEVELSRVSWMDRLTDEPATRHEESTCAPKGSRKMCNCKTGDVARQSAREDG